MLFYAVFRGELAEIDIVEVTWRFFDIAKYFADVLSRSFWRNASVDAQVKFLT